MIGSSPAGGSKPVDARFHVPQRLHRVATTVAPLRSVCGAVDLEDSNVRLSLGTKGCRCARPRFGRNEEERV
jgi:hypothetical protein